MDTSKIKNIFKFSDKKKEERDARHEAVVDKGIELSTLGVITTGASTAVAEVAHVITKDLVWGHLVATTFGLFYAFVAVDVTFIGYRMYRLIKSQGSLVDHMTDLKMKEARIEALLDALNQGQGPNWEDIVPEKA